MADTNGCDPLEVWCPTCKSDAGTACVWAGWTIPHPIFHAAREARAKLPDLSGDPVTDEAFDRAVAQSGLV